MPYAEMIHMHVSEAYLCSCGIIGNNAKQCACGQEHGLLSLQAVLDREPVRSLDVGVTVVWKKAWRPTSNAEGLYRIEQTPIPADASS